MTTGRVILVPDGMADEALPELGGRTPVEAARTPNLDALARVGAVGLVRTIPPGMPPGSDVASLSVLGYDPTSVYTGRSPLEAASIGVELAPGDVAYRCNFVTITDGVLRDNTAGQIGSDEAARLIGALQAKLGGGPFEFHAGVGYRNLLVWRGGVVVPCTPPHDVLDQPVAAYLPADEGPAAMLADLASRAHDILAPLRPATEVWFWGEGRRPSIPSFRDARGLCGAVVGAVDLVRGLGRYAGFDVVNVPGATGGLDTDYAAKAEAALRALDDHDLVFVHVEAPDEAAHMGDVGEKIRAIERVDSDVLGRLRKRRRGLHYLVLPDHHTPVRLRTHVDWPVPFVMTGSGAVAAGEAGASAFGESVAAATGLALPSGAALMDLFLAQRPTLEEPLAAR